MAISKELNHIKKTYGENFMKLCRNLFPTLLEYEGLLSEVLAKTFSENCKTLYEDIVDKELEENFKSYIYSKVDVEGSEKKIIEEKTPYELLEEVGYNLIECKTEEEIQEFKRYYAVNEELCTFNGGRLNSSVVFFAVKKDVEKIKRSNFKNPKREDEYGTSVMGIQFNKKGICTVSIKNRYNHTVNNPDATYGNDLDRIAPRLTQSFANLLRERGLELNSQNIERFSILNYVVANDGKYYKFNTETQAVYYCPGNVVIENGQAHKLKDDSQILMDYFVLDTKNKTIELYDKNIQDSFPDDLKNLKKIEVKKDKENSVRNIIIHKKDEEEPIVIKLNKNNNIIGYKNDRLTKVGDGFLRFNEKLSELELPQLTEAGKYFLCYNEGLTKVELLKLIKTGSSFLHMNEKITQIKLPKLIETGDDFLYKNEGLRELELPELTETGKCFLKNNKRLNKLKLPKLTKVGDGFLRDNKGLKELDLPELTKVGDDFLERNEEVAKLKVPRLIKVGKNFLCYNKELTKLELPELIEVGDDFLERNEELSKLKASKLTKVGRNFLCYNKRLTKLELPELTEAGRNFLFLNKRLTNLKVPKFRKIDNFFSISNINLARSVVDKNKKKIDCKDIARLDKDSKLTISEVNLGKRILEKVKKIFKGKDR